ncbi:MAG: YidC/Oxa1 family membrane protein insertase [Candidatus Nomurabacteria bacterium]|jgi:YidC/Oxa1 family membrane protein insertase|nr:YidC/Oxa1 family membrane protein insertase [Candidatus Nomurabacteria bacterium]
MSIWDLVVVQPIFNLLLAVYQLVGDFGVAVIIFTLLVKLAMWPLMKKQLYQARLMRKLQPELAEIKKRCKGNKQMESLQMMELYKRHNAKPFASILTLVIQLPIFIAIYGVVRNALSSQEAVAKFAYGFMHNWSRVAELLNNFDEFAPKMFGLVDLRATPLPLATLSAGVLLLITIGSAVLQYVMTKQNMPKRENKRTLKQIMQEAADGKEADQSEVNEIVQGRMAFMMPLMMLFIMIQLPGAIILYYFMSNLVSVMQQKMILNKDLDTMENLADKKVLKELREIQEGEIVERQGEKTVTRVKLADKKSKKKGK